MSEHEERIPETQPEGRLEPPVRKPPTAIGSGTTEPDERPLREIVVPIGTNVKDLARVLHVSSPRILWVAFNQLKRIVRPGEVLPFAETKALAAHFGYSARRPGSGEE